LEANFQTTPKNKPFRFEKFWIEYPTFNDHINQWWQEELLDQGTRMLKLYKRLKYIKHKLKEWNKKIFGNINQEKKKYRGQNEDTPGTLHRRGLHGG
jgi:hypothetical protein